MPSTSSVVRAALVAGSVASASVLVQPRQMVTETCSDVHIFLAKGNNEPYPGRQGKLVSAICGGLNSCDYEDIQMRNMLEDEYCGAVQEGAGNGVKQIVAYNQRCPDTKLVVSGYSQGAHVAGDIFGGGGGSYFNGCVAQPTPNLDINSPAGKRIAAILTFGDVRHTASQPYNYLDGAQNWGLYPRNSQQLANAINYASVWRDYCAAGDPICAGGNTVEEHLNYFDLYTEEAAKFVVDKVNAVQAVPKPTTSADKPKPSSTSKAEEAASSAAPSTEPASSTATTVTVGGSAVVVTTVHGPTTTVEATSTAVTGSAEASETTVVTSTTTTSEKPFASEHPQSTMSYVANPTTVVKPTTVASYEAVASEYHTKGLPEATHKPTENLSAIPTTAAGVPSVNPDPVASATHVFTSKPAAAAPTHANGDGDIVPNGAGATRVGWGAAGLAAAAVAALLL